MDALVARLDTLSGFTSMMRGMFADNSGRKSHAIWTSAQRKGVYETVQLRFSAQNSHGYAVMAFSDDGPLDPNIRETLAAQAERFPQATVRFESTVYAALTPLGWHPRAYEPSDHTIEAIADPYPGVRVFTAVTNPRAADRPFVAHCVVDGRDYIYPIPGDRL